MYAAHAAAARWVNQNRKCLHHSSKGALRLPVLSVLCDEGCHDEAFSRALPEPRGSQEYRKSDEFRGNWRLWNDVVGRKSKQ